MQRLIAIVNQALRERFTDGVRVLDGAPYYLRRPAAENLQINTKYLTTSFTRGEGRDVLNSLEADVGVTLTVRIMEKAQNDVNVQGDVLLFAQDVVGMLYTNDTLSINADVSITHVDGTTETVSRDSTAVAVLPSSVFMQWAPDPPTGVVMMEVAFIVTYVYGEDVWQPRTGSPDLLHRFGPESPVPLRQLYATGLDDDPQLVAQETM